MDVHVAEELVRNPNDPTRAIVVRKTINSKGNVHSFDGQPAITIRDADTGLIYIEEYFNDGFYARENDLPTYTSYTSVFPDLFELQVWLRGTHTEFERHRHSGPSVVMLHNGLRRNAVYDTDGKHYGLVLYDNAGNITNSQGKKALVRYKRDMAVCAMYDDTTCADNLFQWLPHDRIMDIMGMIIQQK